MRILELVEDAATQKLSSVKIWQHVAFAAGTFAFVKTAILGSAGVEIWLTYLGVVGGADVVKRIAANKKEVEMAKTKGQ